MNRNEIMKEKIKKNGLLHAFYSFFNTIIKGYKIYKNIQNKYGHECKIYIGQHPGTGDVYLQSKFLSVYAEKQGVTEYVFVVIGGAAYSVAKLFDYKKIEKLTSVESNVLVEFYRFMGESLNIEILHYHPMMMYYGGLGYARNYHEYNFFKMLHKFVFPGTNINMLQKPSYDNNKEFVDTLFKAFFLKSKKTVLLCPYANSLIGFPSIFWEKLVNKLIEKGFTVCTNSCGINEPAIKGSCAVYIPYKYLKTFASEAGFIISYRSGFSDIISEIPCKKIILYSKQKIYNFMGGLGSSYDYFSLKNMGLCLDAIEYEFKMKNEKSIKNAINTIMNNFC